MPAKDVFQSVVENALLKDGWTITHNPLFVQFGGIDVYVDLGAERIIAANKGERKIAIEIKSFIKPSVISDFHTAVGQFINYRIALEAEDPNRILYLAVPSEVYKTFFSLPFTQTVVERNQFKLIVYNVKQEIIEKWQE